MGECKRLKDPIYGYIDIPTDYMYDIVDTAPFQRLRRVIQTSYSPLYSSAVHNRFVHSLGVYHLGELAVNSLISELSNKVTTPIDLERIRTIFLLACLLHDVGHAPFSHTGEAFYLNEKREYSDLHNSLIKIVSNQEFANDVPKTNSTAAAPHEIMSVIIGLTEYDAFFNDEEEKSFFARCITGYQYTNKRLDTDIKNCFILLLNSKVIDVDKLDYLIRDAFITGFNTVSIDYNRLLSSLTIINNDDGLQLAYYKNAISVIENVVYAHDSERKWIQNHPIVLYENYILQNIISYLSNAINTDEKKLFSSSSLSNTGQSFDNNLNVRLLCDDDIIYLTKNVYANDCSNEYFERKKRRHPIWKSEAEYRAFFLGIAEGGNILSNFEDALKSTVLYLSKSSDSWVINDTLITKIEHELQMLDELDLDQDSKSVQKKEKTNILKVITFLKNYSKELEINFDFVILMASQFNSGFAKPDFSNTNIVFSSGENEKISKFGKIVSSYSAKEKARENFFYLFYSRSDNSESNIDKESLCKRLLIEFI